MQMTNLKIIDTINKLGEFVKKDIPMPVKVSYAITKNARALENEYQVYDAERVKYQGDNDKIAELLNIERSEERRVGKEC